MCVGSAVCTWVIVSLVCVGQLVCAGSVLCVCVCVCSLSSVEPCDVLSLGRWPGVFIVTPLAFI